ncbi:MAG: hypothetical protein KatS3mg087_1762 [Patescibacteria group bacterium]|nr:MAG: hypothetical protein KatS3mg087_1762 [Patescibacteria group bacterium]
MMFNNEPPQGAGNPPPTAGRNNPFDFPSARTYLDENLKRLMEGDPQFDWLRRYFGDKSIEEFMKTQTTMDELQSATYQVYEMLDQLKNAPSPLSTPPPQMEGLSKEESLALAIGALFNFQAAGLAALGAKKRKEEKYVQETERYKMMTELALQDYNLRYNRAATAVSQLAQAAGAAAQKQLNLLTAIQTFYPQLERLSQEKQNKAVQNALDMLKLQYESEIKRDTNIEELQIKTFKQLQDIAQWAWEKGLFNTAEEAFRVMFNYFGLELLPAVSQYVEPNQILAISNEDWAQIYKEIRETGQLNRRIQEIRYELMQADLAGKDVEQELKNMRIQELEAKIAKLAADTDLSQARAELVKAQKALAAMRTSKLAEGKMETSSQVANAIAISSQLGLTARALKQEAEQLERTGANNPQAQKRIQELRQMADELERNARTINIYVGRRTGMSTTNTQPAPLAPPIGVRTTPGTTNPTRTNNPNNPTRVIVPNPSGP